MLTIKQNDLEPDLEVAVTKASGSVVDFTDALSAILRFRKPDGTIVLRSAVIASPASGGRLQVAWQAGDTNQVGIYRGEFIVTWPAAEPQTFPSEGYFYWDVTPPIS